MNSICRDCLAQINENTSRCPYCSSPRVLSHPELFSLTTAHIDCDAFYASVEKRDNPKFKDNYLKFCMEEGKTLIIEGIENEVDPMIDPVLEK